MVIAYVTVHLIPGSALKLMDQFVPKEPRFLGKYNMPGLALQIRNTYKTLYKSALI